MTEVPDSRGAPAAAARRRAIPALAAPGGWLLAATVLAGLVLRPAFGDELLVTRYTGYVMPWLLVALLPGALWACRARRWALAAALGGPAIVIAGIHAPLFVPRARPPAPAAATLKVMSFNTWSRNRDVARIAGAIRAEAADLVLLQEIPPDVLAPLRDALRDLYGGGNLYWAYEADVEQAVLSRHPLEPRPLLAARGRAQQVVVHSPSGPITVFNVHPLRTGGWRDRYRQIAALLEEHVLQERSPVILAGDLNVNDRTQLYRLVAGRLRNAHEAAGYGFGFTYPAAVATWRALPVVRIDHVFFSHHFVALRAGTLEDSGGSDHRPVFAELALVERSDAPAPAPRAPSRGAPATAATPRVGPSATRAVFPAARRRACRGRLRAGGGATGGRCADSPRLRSPAEAPGA